MFLRLHYYSKSQISTINKYALNEFTKAGGTFAVATGRTLHSCKQYIPELPINAPSIFYNGTILQDTNNNVVLKTLLKSVIIITSKWS